MLTHWGRLTHVCVSKLTIICSDNGLSPGRRQAIIWTNDGILLIRHLGTNFSEIFSEIHTFSFKKMHFKTSSAKWRRFCLGLNDLTDQGWGLLELRLLIYPSAKFSILQKYLLDSLNHIHIWQVSPLTEWEYREISIIRRTKSLKLNDSRLVLQLALPNPLKPGVKSRMTTFTDRCLIEVDMWLW